MIHSHLSKAASLAAAILLGLSVQTSAYEDEIYPGSLKPGDAAPDFELPDADGNIVRLSSLLEKGPVVVVFYRGVW